MDRYKGILIWALIFIGLFLADVSCRRDKSKMIYQDGDIVYLKPDSTKAVIIQINRMETRCDYEIRCDYKEGFGYDGNIDIEQHQIFNNNTVVLPPESK